MCRAPVGLAPPPVRGRAPVCGRPDPRDDQRRECGPARGRKTNVRKENSQPMTVRVARWSATHPWRAIAMWMVFVAVCFTAGSMTGTTEGTDEDEWIGESGHAS